MIGADEAREPTEVRVAADTSQPAAPSSSERHALIVFVAAEIVGFFTYLVVGRFMWFYRDDWSVIANSGWRDALHPHGGHLIALPFVALRAMYLVFGLHTYLPYLATVVVLHLVVAALLRAVIRRSGVGGWVATAAACLYIFFGAGSQNTLWAFQMTFLGAVVFGLAQLLLADHPGPLGRRDWLGLGAGLLGVLCSGVALTMVAVVGIYALLRRRWAAALFHTVPLGAGWLLWSYLSGNKLARSMRPRLLVEWDSRGLRAVFRSLGYWAPVGVALALLLIIGLALVAGTGKSGSRADRLAMPIAILVGAFLFLTLTGASRAFFGLQYSTSSRYLDVYAVFLLPSIALAADAVVRRRRALLPLVLALLLIGIPGNIRQASSNVPPARYFRGYRQMMLSLPRMALATRVPGSVQPEPNEAPTVTVSWLLDETRSGRVPKTRAPTPVERATNRLRLSLKQSLGSVGRCREINSVVPVVLRRGAAFSVQGTVVIQLVSSGLVSKRVTFGANLFTGSKEHLLVAVGGPLALRVGPLSTVKGAAVCAGTSNRPLRRFSPVSDACVSCSRRREGRATARTSS